MPQFTITVSDQLLQRLQAIVTAYNSNAGTTYTVRDWILLHLKDLALHEDVTAKARELEKQKQEELTQALEAERQRLLATL